MIAAALGIVVGLILGLTGAGGSIFAVPLLVFGLGLDLMQATPIALLAVFGASAFGALVALRAGQVCYRAALTIGVIGSLATPAGVFIASRASPRIIYLVFAGIMLLVALRMFLQARVPSRSAPSAAHPKGQVLVLGLSGIGTGLLSGALGVGAGFIIVPSLRAATSLSMSSVVATSLLAIAIISGSAVVSHVAHGQGIAWTIAMPFLAGALAGMWAGRSLATRLSGARLQQSFAALMAVAAVAMAARGM